MVFILLLSNRDRFIPVYCSSYTYGFQGSSVITAYVVKISQGSDNWITKQIFFLRFGVVIVPSGSTFVFFCGSRFGVLVNLKNLCDHNFRQTFIVNFNQWIFKVTNFSFQIRCGQPVETLSATTYLRVFSQCHDRSLIWVAGLQIKFWGKYFLDSKFLC